MEGVLDAARRERALQIGHRLEDEGVQARLNCKLLLLVGPGEDHEAPEEGALDAAVLAADDGRPLKEIAAEIAERLGLKRREVPSASSPGAAGAAAAPRPEALLTRFSWRSRVSTRAGSAPVKATCHRLRSRWASWAGVTLRASRS